MSDSGSASAKKRPSARELTFQTRDGFKIDPPHSPGCYLAEQGRHEFIVHEGFAYRDRIGRKSRGGRSWHIFRCNCIDCEARLLVRWDVLMEFLREGLMGE